MSSHNQSVQHVVTAVIVAHDGATWLPHVVEALLNQTRPVDRVVAVDTGSRDRSGAALAQALGHGAVFGMDRATGYAAAVRQALRHRAANAHVPPVAGRTGEQVEWVWLLHDDCEPELDALQKLLQGAAQATDAAVLGPKVMDWSDREVLLETGCAIDRAGRRITGIEPREVDQGQHDGDRDVLAVGSAGMLVRRDVWERVGGFDPTMRLYWDDVDFCWRVLAAGQRVRVITDAIVYHVQASARNRRQASAAPHRARESRRNALLVLAGNLPTGPMLASLAGNLVLSLLRTAFFLLAKRPAAALDETAALASVLGQPLRLMAVRRRRARGRRATYSHVRADIPSGRSFRKLAEYATTAFSASNQPDMVGSHHATDDPSDDDSLLVDSGLVQRVLTNPGVLLFLGLTVVTLVAARSLLASVPLAGGALVPAWGGASTLWQEYLQGFHPVGIGTAASAPPYVAVIAALATVLGGKPWLAVDVTLIGCVPLAGITAYLAARRVTTFVPARIWAATTYALLPVAMGSVAAGRLGAAVVLVLLPLAGMLIGRVFTGSPRRSRRAAWAAGLVMAVAVAFVPLIWPIAVVGLAAGALAYGRRRPARALNALIAAVVPLVLLLPWSASLLAHPSLFLLEAGLRQGGLASAALPARSLLLLSPGGPGLPPVWVSAGVVITAALALVAARRRSLILAGWAMAVIGLLVAAGVSRLTVIPPGGTAPLPAWPGAAVAVAGAGLMLAAVAAGDRLPRVLGGGRWRRPAGWGALVLAVLACSAPALAAASWVSRGVRGPVGASAGPLLPEFVSVTSDTGRRLRTLVLHPTGPGRLDYAVVRNAEPALGTAELTTPPAAQRALNLAVARLAAPSGGNTGDQGRALAGFGIGYVLMPAPLNGGLARILDGIPGLSPVSQTSSFELWQVAGNPARVRVVQPDGTTVPVASGPVNVDGAHVPAAGGTLVLAEPSGGWKASLNGHPLTPLPKPVGGWAQGFRLPPGGGTVTIRRDGLPRDAAITLEGLAVLVVAVLGLPGAKVAGEAEGEASGEAGAETGPEEVPAGADRRRAGRDREVAQERRGNRVLRRGRAAVSRSRPASPAGSRLAGTPATGRRGGPPGRSARPGHAAGAPPGRGVVPAGARVRGEDLPGSPAGAGRAGADPYQHREEAVRAAEADSGAMRSGRGGPAARGRLGRRAARERGGPDRERGGPDRERGGPDRDVPDGPARPGRGRPRWEPASRGVPARGRGEPGSGPGYGYPEAPGPRPEPGLRATGDDRERTGPRARFTGPAEPASGRRSPYPGRGGQRGPGQDMPRGRGAAPGRDDGYGRSPRPQRPDVNPDGGRVPRGRLPGDDATLPPLPPLPPRSSRGRDRAHGYPPDGDDPDGWDRGPRHDAGEADW